MSRDAVVLVVLAAAAFPLLLWAIGQLAAWQPARRAAAVPPSVATRTV